MRASLVVVPLVTLVAGAVCGGALGYAMGARSAMERERSAIEAAVAREREAFQQRAASAAPQAARLLDAARQQQTDASPAQPDAGIGGGAGGAVHSRIEAAREQRLDPARQRCVGGFVREIGEGTDEKGRRIGERDLLENGRKVECSGGSRK